MMIAGDCLLLVYGLNWVRIGVPVWVMSTCSLGSGRSPGQNAEGVISLHECHVTQFAPGSRWVTN